MRSVDLIIRARWVVPVSPTGTLENHAVVIDHGRILAVEPGENATDRYEAKQFIDLPTHCLLPGFTNAWCGFDAHSTAWNRLRVAEMLRSGVTCTQLGQSSDPDQIRTFLSEGLRIGAAIDWRNDRHAGLSLRDTFAEHPLFSAAFIAGHAGELTTRSLRELGALSNELDLPVYVAVDSSDTVRRLEEAGLLSPALVVATVGNLDARDIAALAGAGARRILTPRADRIGPAGAWPPGAIVVATGHRDAAGDLNVLADLRASLWPEFAPEVIDALARITRNAASAMGLAAECGVLGAGFWGDVIAFDLARPMTMPFDDPARAVLRAASRQQLSDAWVAGHRLLADGEITGFDERRLVESLVTSGSMRPEDVTA